MERTLDSQYRLKAVTSVAEAIQAVDQENFNLFLIDVGLPDGDGFGLCTLLRNQKKGDLAPIMFLSAKGELNDKLKAFSLGADDYVVKPFEPLELRARIDAKLKRVEKEPSEKVSKGELTLHIPYQRATLQAGVQSIELDLTPVEFRLLYHFVRNEGIVLTRDHLLKNVWGENMNVVDRTIDKHVSSLRRKLGIRANYIESIYSVGYVFSAEEKPRQV